MSNVYQKYNLKTLFAILFLIIKILADNTYAINSTENKIISWAVVKTLHFDIYYPEELSDLAVYTAKSAEESYVYLADRLQYELNTVVPVIIYNDNNINKTEDSKKINISFTGSYLTFHKNFTRKLANIFQYNILYSSAPGWEIPGFSRLADSQDIFLDTMAYYLSTGFDDSADMMIKDIIISKRKDYFFNIKSLKKIRKDISREIGRSFFFYLEKEYGRDVIAELLLNITDYNTIYKAIEMTTGKTISIVNSNWADFYMQRYSDIITKETTDKENIPANEKTIFQFPIGFQYDKSYLLCLTIKDDIYNIIKINLYGNKSEQLLSYNRPRTHSSSYKESIYLWDDFPSLTKDNKIFVSTKQAENNTIILYNLSTGKNIKEIKLPFKITKDANISADGKLLAFIGQSNNSSDVYLYNIQDNRLSRVTNDYFTKRFPKLSEDNSFIVFSSNENKENNIESENFKLIRIDLKSNAKTFIVDNNTKNIHPDISPDNRKILFSSNVSGTYNIYYYDLNTGKNTQVTDTQYGAFHPRWHADEKTIIYSAYDNFTYNIRTKDLSIPLIIKEKKSKPDFTKPIFPASYFNLNDLAVSDYSDERNIKYFTALSGLAWDDGFAGSVKIKAADLLNEHKLSFNSDLLYQKHHNKNKSSNFNLDYEYNKYHTEFGIGSFYRTHPSQFDFFNDYNTIINFYPDNINTNNYGIYTNINYPFTKQCKFKIKGSYNAYEDLKLFYDNIYLKEISFSFDYDNIIINKVWPVSGSRFNLAYTYDFSAGNRDISFNNAVLNFLQVFHYEKLFVFSVKGSGGKIFGKDDDYFKYYIGGFSSIRGHDLFAYKGQNYFLLNLETKFIIIDKFIINWPAAIKFYDISLVLFADCGSAWNNDYKFKNSNTGEFEDFKAAFGTGLRFLLQNHLVFKLDAAWPYYYKSFGKREIIAGFELRY